MSRAKYTCEQFEAAIPGSGGIISTIARRVGCHWEVAKKFIDVHATLKTLYESELEVNLDVAESLIITNIKIASSKQQAGIKSEKPELVDTTDAKWFVSKKGKGRGYTERQETFNLDLSQLTTNQLDRIAKGED